MSALKIGHVIFSGSATAPCLCYNHRTGDYRTQISVVLQFERVFVATGTTLLANIGPYQRPRSQ